MISRIFPRPALLAPSFACIDAKQHTDASMHDKQV